MKIHKGNKPIKIKYTGKKPCTITRTGDHIEIETTDTDFIKKMKKEGFIDEWNCYCFP